MTMKVLTRGLTIKYGLEKRIEHSQVTQFEVQEGTLGPPRPMLPCKITGTRVVIALRGMGLDHATHTDTHYQGLPHGDLISHSDGSTCVQVCGAR